VLVSEDVVEAGMSREHDVRRRNEEHEHEGGEKQRTGRSSIGPKKVNSGTEQNAKHSYINN